ncbi:MAG: hypothetical protein OEN01_16060, partial [Candidatus Krumholzibacteria bacterium]|nr:hypothetical protein [Candidatus Krumholzibacteria bacterium]
MDSFDPSIARIGVSARQRTPSLMVMLGPKGALVVYLCTLVALTISFGLGRLLPARLLVSLLRWLTLTRASTLLQD